MDSIENLETNLLKLQNDIEIMKESLSLKNIDQKNSSINERAEFKNNSAEIKQLEKQVGELKFRLKRQQLNDFQIMEEAIHQKCKEPSELKASSAKELLEKLESRVLDLSIRAESQLHHLKHLERTFKQENELLKKMKESCRENEHSADADCVQKIRHLENANSKILKDIEDTENANDKMKRMLKNVQKKNITYISLLEELKNEQVALTHNENKEVKEEVKSHRGMNPEKKETEFVKLKHDISLIRDTICCQDIRDIDLAFLEQKATNKDVAEMSKKAEQRIFELKEEKRNLASKKALIKELDSVYPNCDEDLSLSKSRLEEQRNRLDVAKKEMDRINSHTKKTKDVFQTLIIKMNPKVNKTEMLKKDVKQLSRQLENVVKYTVPTTEPKFGLKSQKQDELHNEKDQFSQNYMELNYSNMR